MKIWFPQAPLRQVLFVAAALILTGRAAAAEPPSEATLAGDWWCEDPAIRITLARDHTAKRFWRDNGEPADGRWEIADGKLSLNLSEGEPAVYECSVIDDQMTLKTGTETLTFRKGDAGAREKELAMLLHEHEELKKTFATGEEDEVIRKTLERSVHTSARIRLLLSLLAGRGNESLELMRRVLTRHSPEDLPTLEAHSEDKRDHSCSNSLKQLSIYLALYEAKFRKYPEKLEQVKRPDMATDEALFTCPVLGKGHPYVYVYSSEGDATPDAALTLYCDSPHEDGQRRFVTFTGRAWELPEEAFKEVLRTGTITGVFPSLEDRRVKVEESENGCALVVRFVGRGLHSSMRDGKPVFRVTVTARLSNMDLNRTRPPETTEAPAIGDGMEIELRWRVPKPALAGSASLILGIRDESTGRSVDAWESLER